MQQLGFLTIIAACVNLALPAFIQAQAIAPPPVARLEREYALLASVGIAAEPHAILEYLRSYVPKQLTAQEMQAAVEKLGSNDFHERQAAVQELTQSPNFPEELLKAGAESSDLEIRWRARLVLSQRGKRDWRYFQAALRILAESPPPELFELALELTAYYYDESNQNLLHRVLTNSARESHADQLLQLEGTAPATKRLAAAMVLRKLRPTESLDLFVKLAQDMNPTVALHAAKTLGNAGDRRALAPLIQLLGQDDRVIAEDSACFLRVLTQHDFSLPPMGAKEEWLALQSQLQQWLREQGATVALRFPVQESAIVRGDLAGNLLVSNGTRVMELTPHGKEVWAYPIQAWSAEKLRRGNVLIASYQANQILEVDQAGKVLWKLDGINAMRAKPLADDHVLVAHFSGSRVIELNAQRQEVWTHTTPDNCFDAERLPNGNTVFACPNLIREVNREGNTIKSLEIEGRVNSLQILPTGDYLVSNYGKNQVQQYDAGGKIVWRFDEFAPNDSYRLKNGNTLITSSTRCVEVDASGRLVRTIQPSNYGCARQ